MAKSLPEIIYDKTKITPIIDSNNSYYQIPMYKDEPYLSSIETYTQFVKGIESQVRHNDRYNKYINYLKKEVKLDHCQVLKNIDDKDADIEMHHGPIFNLFDICSIVLEYFRIKGWKISTFRVADQVLDEHQKNRVQVVMLSVTMHELVHEKEIFINYHQAYGDLKAFLDKYSIALLDEQKEKLNRYIDRSTLQDSTDYDVLQLNDYLFGNKK